MNSITPDNSLLAEASKTSSELLRRTIVSAAIMNSALDIPKYSDFIKAKTFSDHFSGASGFRAFLDEAQLIVPIDPEKPSGDMDKVFEAIAKSLAEQAAINGEMVIAAAVVVLSHSMADDVFTSVCDLAVRLDRTKWIPELNLERTFSLRALTEKGSDGIFSEELERFRRALSGKSLPTRADMLFRNIRIVHNPMYSLTDPEYFQLTRLQSFDELRKSIVHGAVLPRVTLDQSMDAKRFLHEAATTAVRSLAFAYKLPLDMSVFLQQKTAPPTV